MNFLITIISLFGVVLSQGLKEYHKSNIGFASDIYREYSKNRDGNFLICPLSAQTILSLVAVGAKEDTLQQLTTALHVPSDTSKIENMFKEISPYFDIDEKYQLSSANKIFMKEGVSIKNEFKTVAQNIFKADIQEMNFENKRETVSEINEWVETKTHNKITDLLKEEAIKPETVTILVNAVYFKGDWVNKFGTAFPSAFYVNKNKAVIVDTMTNRKHYNYYYNKGLDAEFLELPFIGNDVVMTFALPKQKDGLSTLEQSISNVLSEQPFDYLDAIVSIPKFTMETEINFNTILESLGAKLPFSDGANFRGICDVSLKIDEVVQKTFIEVTETGATAAGATYVSMMLESMPLATFTADHPFIYYLKHKVHGVFFVGRYTKP